MNDSWSLKRQSILSDMFPRFFAAVWDSQMAKPTNDKTTMILSIGFPASNVSGQSRPNAHGGISTMTACQS